jgi:hypothetical protein
MRDLREGLRTASNTREGLPAIPKMQAINPSFVQHIHGKAKNRNVDDKRTFITALCSLTHHDWDIVPFNSTNSLQNASQYARLIFRVESGRWCGDGGGVSHVYECFQGSGHGDAGGGPGC